MVKIEDRSDQSRMTETSQTHVPSTNRFVESYKNWDNPDYTFEEIYSSTTLYEAKYEFAKALIEHDAYPDPRFLINSFIFHGPHPDMTKEERKNAIMQAKEYRDDLKLLLIKKGEIDPDEVDAKEMGNAVMRFIASDEELSMLHDVLPIHVMGAVTSVKLFKNLTEQEKQEKYRSFTTNSLLRKYLGDLLVQKHHGELDINKIITLMPKEVFADSNEVVNNYLRDFFMNESLKLFLDSEEEGFTRLRETIQKTDEPIHKAFLKGIEEELKEVSKVEIPDVFYKEVAGWDRENVPFPHFRQKYFVHEFMQTRRKLLNGGTGATKTACAFLGMESLGRHRVTIFGPGLARQTWPAQAEKHFLPEKKPDVFTIESREDLDNPRVKTAKYVYVSSTLLSYSDEKKDQELREKIFTRLVDDRETDGIIVDESHVFNKVDASCSNTFMDLTKYMRETHEKTWKELGEEDKMPILALTATPMSSALEDFDIMMGVLYPEKFSLPEREEPDKTIFSAHILREPKGANLLLFGEKLMMRWGVKDLFGDRIPLVEDIYHRVPVPMSAAQNAVYEWIAGRPVNSLAKMDMLHCVLLNPEIIKTVCHKKEWVPKEIRPKDELMGRFVELYDAWMQWSLSTDVQEGKIPHESFSPDWIAKYDREFYLECFFSKELVHDVRSLAYDARFRYSSLQADWRQPDAESPKYSILRKILTRGPNGTHPTDEKTFIVSPHRREGITRDMEDKDLKIEDLQLDALSLYEYMIGEWGLDRRLATTIDGSHSFTRRTRHSEIWREKGDEDLIVLASMKSVYESMDWAVRESEGNNQIKKIRVVWLGLPYDWDEFVQMNGRFLRPGLGKEVSIDVLESENSLDIGMYENIHRKHLLMQLVLAGVKLSPEDEAFFKNSTTGDRIIVNQPEEGQVFLRHAIAALRGQGEQALLKQLGKEGNDGISHFERWARAYYEDGKDEFRVVGNNAELMKNILLSENPSTVLSIGAGTCLLARKLRQDGYTGGITNLDLNEAKLYLAKERHPQIGETIVGRASNLREAGIEDNSFEALDMSFMLDLTNLYDEKDSITKPVHDIERVKILSEMNRVLKQNGRAVISLSDGALDEEHFMSMAGGLKSFGFEVEEPSGRTSAIDTTSKTRKLGWVFTLKKVGNVNLKTLDPFALTLLSDISEVISEYKGEKKPKQRVINIEYPIFSPKEFEVFNPLTGIISVETTIKDFSETPAIIEVPIDETIVIDPDLPKEVLDTKGDEEKVDKESGMHDLQEDSVTETALQSDLQNLAEKNDRDPLDEEVKAILSTFKYKVGGNQRRTWHNAITQIERITHSDRQTANRRLVTILKSSNLPMPADWSPRHMKIIRTYIGRLIERSARDWDELNNTNGNGHSNGNGRMNN